MSHSGWAPCTYKSTFHVSLIQIYYNNMQNGSHDNSVPKSTFRMQPNCIILHQNCIVEAIWICIGVTLTIPTGTAGNCEVFLLKV